MENTDQLNNLFQKYLNQSCSPDEIKQLLDYFGDVQLTDDELLAELIGEVLKEEQLFVEDDRATRARLDICLENIMANRTMPVKTRKIWLSPKWAVAAGLLIAAFTALFYFTQTNLNEVSHTVAQEEFKPGTDKARLTLADGTVIDLEEAINGKLENANGIAVTKAEDGKLVYDAKNATAKSTKVSYNTLITPRGGQYKVVLPDGSLIWLNAASSLRFPTLFVGEDRRVELVGEGYFEIVRNVEQPFVVVTGGQEVTVLGTHFNINAYQETNIIRTTLLEGAVKVSKGTKSFLLAPGQEARLDILNNGMSIVKNVDVDAAVAWKDGRFSFDKTNIKEVMQQVARWYDVDILYKGDFSNVEFTGDISRGIDARSVLNLLKGTKQVDFVIDGRIITIIPYINKP